MWSAVPNAPLVIIMFVMFVVNGTAAPDSLMSYEKPVYTMFIFYCNKQ